MVLINTIDAIDTKAPFRNVLSIAKTEITSLLRGNDKITALLWFDSSDALDQIGEVTTTIKNNVYRQSSASKKVFLSGFDGQAVKDVRSEIHISFENIRPIQTSTTKIPYLRIDIIVADSINVLNDGMSLRHDYLFQEVCDTIEGFSVGTVGFAELENAQETVLINNTHVIWSARFKVGEIKR